jgi:hypothetical protein
VEDARLLLSSSSSEPGTAFEKLPSLLIDEAKSYTSSSSSSLEATTVRKNLSFLQSIENQITSGSMNLENLIDITSDKLKEFQIDEELKRTL